MSGKAYTMKEMKNIVEYLVEHKAYGEIRGRKMWKDLADSNITTRTWQSLKETFLKRILPDIQNPYYKLTLHQISSFKQGRDIEAKLNNKLQIRSASRDSNTEGEDKTNEPPDNSEEKNENQVAGEDPKQTESDIRASTETLVLEDCYENAEDKDESPKKSLRELITYSEPLTPMLQAVIDDFATDEGEGSNDEPKMQIVELPDTDMNGDSEDKETTDTAVENAKPEEPQEKPSVEVTDSMDNKSLPPPKYDLEAPNDKDTVNESSKNGDLTIVLSDSEEITKNNKDDTVDEKPADVNKPKTSIEMTQHSNTTTDTLIPDNQEGFKGNSQSLSNNSKQLVKEAQDKKRAKKRANSQEDQPTVSTKKRFIKEKQSISDTDTFVKNKRNMTINKSNQITFKQKIPEGIEEPVLKENSKTDQMVENTRPEKDQEETKAENSQDNEKNSEEFENPCLKSVSLYAEQFSNSKYTDSETSNIEEGSKNGRQNKKDEKSPPTSEVKTNVDKESPEVKKTDNTAKSDERNGVVVLKSHSDSISDSGEEKKIKGRDRSAQQQRNKAMANMFGFSSGGVSRSRKNGNTHRKHTSSRNQTLDFSSDSSQWSWESGLEYVSPPRGRKNRQTRKYLKPKSARILSMEEEGGLFVMYGKKIYPVVKDGKIIKNYVTYAPDNECDQEESFWKLKYVEEKKRTAELTKLLNQVKEKNGQGEPSRIPVLPTTSRTLDENPKKPIEVVDTDNKLAAKEAGEQKVDPTQEGKTVKIKFTKNNEEVQLEGHWSHVNPVLAQVMQLLQKEPAVNKEAKPKQASSVGPRAGSAERPERAGPAALADEEVHEKVNKIESEIFKEIEEREKQKTPTPSEEVPPREASVTKRKGRPKKSDTNATEQSPAKKPKVDTESKTNEVDSSQVQTTIATRRTTRTPKKATTDKPDTTEGKVVKTRQTAKKSLAEIPQDSQEDVRYKFPSPPPTTRKSTNNSNKVTKNTRQRKSSSLVNVKIYSSPENLSLHSIESTQGYIDSDESPIKTYMRRKKRMTFTLPSYKSKAQTRRKITHPYLTDDVTSESSNSFQGHPLKSMTFQNSTLKSDVYKSESYQLLMNKNVTLRNKSSSQLEKIEEMNPLSIDVQYISDQICKDVSDIKINKETHEKENLNADSSSNVTLPTSPVLSIVENISISKSLLENSNELPFEEELLQKESEEHVMLNELMKVEDDVSMPLMEQACGIETSAQIGAEYHYNLNVPKTSTAVSEAFFKKINIVNIEDPTLSESIQSKLRDLILDSAKKKDNCNNLIHKNTQDIHNEERLGTKVTKSRKRSSTPRKRNSTRKLHLTNTEPCIEEEHMETCSYTSRKSCPPMIQIFGHFKAANESNTSIQVSESNTEKPKGRKKKDVIKVKISKPKPKLLNKETIEKSIQDIHKSIQKDSGINDTESSVFLNTLNDSIDLIHNHSETCLNANECLGDSVEILQNSTKSIISLDSNPNNVNEDVSEIIFASLPDKLAHELFCDDAQDVSVLQKVVGVPEYKTAESASATVYHTPLGSSSPPDSLITDDLSNEVPEKTHKTKWYLLSEDEISNSNIMDFNQNVLAPIGYGANLNEIFQTCAIPDLSTITEISKENEDNTKKFSDDTNTRNDLDSQSLFNC